MKHCCTPSETRTRDLQWSWGAWLHSHIPTLGFCILTVGALGFFAWSPMGLAQPNAAAASGVNSAPTAPSHIAANQAVFAALARFKELSRKNDFEAALKALDRSQDKFSGASEGIYRLIRGRVLEKLGKVEEAAAEYAKGLEKKTGFEAHLLDAASHLPEAPGRAKPIEALNRLILTSVREPAEVPVALKFRAIYRYAEMLASQEKWRDIVRLIQPILKKARGTESYPSFIYLLYRAKRKTGVSDCRLARDLYSKYPDLPALAAWGPLLPENKIDDLKPACSATVKDIQSRQRRLILAGLVDRSIAEIEVLRARGIFDPWTTDSFEVNALVSQGKNAEAMKILIKHSKENAGRPAFWMLMGKVTSRLGDLAASAGAYKKAYELAPRAKTASDSLFNSAFASYQMQDYDGAEPSFELLSRRFGRSKVARDARWHLAWMSYLRHDYDKALARWDGLLKERRGRNMKGDATSFDRIQYWSAMALLQTDRPNREKEAGERLRALLRDPSIDYYAILAWYRLRTIPGIQLSDTEKKLVFKDGLSEEALKQKVAEEVSEVTQTIVESETPADASSDASSDASADSADASGDATTDTAAEADTSGGDQDARAVEDAILVEAPPSANVRDPGLQRRLERVRLLFSAGLDEETRWELQNLDRRVRHPQDRKTMMSELHRMGRWDRSSVLAELTFSGPRLKGGIDGARDLWEYSYPKAWQETVTSAAKSVGVEEDFVWSIMRAESHYRPEAKSPVGAAGLMQIMPFTGERVSSELMGRNQFKAQDLMDPETNIKIGARYLKRLSEKFGSRLPLVAASYNAGPHRVQSWLKGFGELTMDAFIEHIPFVETRNYVKKVTRNYQIYRLLYKEDRGSLAWLVQPVGVAPLEGPGASDVW